MTGQPGTSEEKSTRITAFLMVAVAVGVVFLALRLFEFAVIVGRFGTPGNGPWLSLIQALGYDLLVLGVLLSGLAAVFLPLALAGRRLAVIVTTATGTLVLVLYLGLIEYFTVVQVPLGADLFGYSRQDIAATLRTSAALDVAQTIPYLLTILATTGIVVWLRRWRPGRATRSALLLGIVVAALLFLPLYPTQTVITSERQATLTGNKLAIFSGSMVRHLHRTHLDRSRMADFEPEREYPLLRDRDADDVLGPLLELGEAPPNIVIVGYEGLGRAFMPGGTWAGFTDVTTRLAEEGLYFPNTIAASGRSFGFLPTIVGSLPPGDRGFMESTRMPTHDTLISLLRDNGYRTHYFVGFDSSFDGVAAFLERQQIDFILDQSQFGADYEKLDLYQGSFTWGYADDDLFRRAAEYLAGVPPDRPRLDIYHTVNLHEPSILPDQDEWERRAMERIDELPVDVRRKSQMRRYPEIFAAILFSEYALAGLIEHYRAREDFDNTVFIITGDHRLIPIPEEDRLDRFAVPMVIWSPMIRSPQRFEAVSTHADLTPSLLAMLQEHFDIALPDQVHWLGRGLDTHGPFRSNRMQPLMRTKNELRDYLSGEYFLSGGDVFRVRENLQLEPVPRGAAQRKVQAEFEEFRQLNQYVMRQDRLRPRREDDRPDESLLLADEEAMLAELGIDEPTPDQVFRVAREAAFQQRYHEARLLGRYLLRQHPNHHDMRTLVGRTHAWSGDYDQARRYFEDVLRRNPLYADAYVALADLKLWSHNASQALEIVHEGLDRVPDDVELLLREARALERLDRPDEAREAVDRILRLQPDHQDAFIKKQRLSGADEPPDR